jgi:hypothetical protein
VSDSVEFISRVHRIEPIDFERGQRAALISAGSGLMLSIMDACPDLRWCIDVDLLDAEAMKRMPDWATCIGNVTDLVVIAGWYCSTNPIPLSLAARSLRRGALLCYVQCRGVGGDPFATLRTAETLDGLLDQINARMQTKKNAAPAALMRA